MRCEGSQNPPPSECGCELRKRRRLAPKRRPARRHRGVVRKRKDVLLPRVPAGTLAHNKDVTKHHTTHKFATLYGFRNLVPKIPSHAGSWGEGAVTLAKNGAFPGLRDDGALGAFKSTILLRPRVTRGVNTRCETRDS
eukprot:scaffold21783_cov124-Isochrysis_galbana.AAC.3